MGDRYAQYARSKLCNVLHALEMQRRFAEEGTRVTAHAASPGRVNTGIFDNLPAFAKALLKPLASALFQTPKQASKGPWLCLVSWSPTGSFFWLSLIISFQESIAINIMHDNY